MISYLLLFLVTIVPGDHKISRGELIMAQSRTYKRYNFLATASINADSNPHVQLSALVDNISQSGIRLQTYEPLKIGTTVRINLTFTTRTGAKSRTTLKGHVARLYRKSDSYFMGIAFDREIKPESNPVLFKYISKGPVKFILRG